MQRGFSTSAVDAAAWQKDGGPNVRVGSGSGFVCALWLAGWLAGLVLLLLLLAGLNGVGQGVLDGGGSGREKKERERERGEWARCLGKCVGEGEVSWARGV
jgi:hypothetical protein